MSTTGTKREYKLAADPIVTNYGAARREILQLVDGHREVIAVVGNDEAMDVLDVLRRAYQDGREDRSSEDEPVKTARFADFYSVMYGDLGSGARALTVITDEPMQIRPWSDRKVIIARA